MRPPGCRVGVAALAAVMFTMQPMWDRSTTTPAGASEGIRQLPPVPAGLRVPPWRAPQRSGAAPTPIALGTAPEMTDSETRQAAMARAVAEGSNVTVVIDGPNPGDLVLGYTPITGWAADLRAGGPGI